MYACYELSMSISHKAVFGYGTTIFLLIIINIGFLFLAATTSYATQVKKRIVYSRDSNFLVRKSCQYSPSFIYPIPTEELIKVLFIHVCLILLFSIPIAVVNAVTTKSLSIMHNFTIFANVQMLTTKSNIMFKASFLCTR